VPTGAWSAGESRDYHVAFALEPQSEGEEMMACRPKVVFTQDGSEMVAAGQPIVATWTSDEAASARIDPNVAHYTGQEELASAIREGLEAKARGNIDEATVLFGKAAKIAIQTGNDEVTARLKKVVDVVDADTGTVRLKSGANKGAELELDMGGTRTVRRRPAAQS
jgi:von Willebrand factor type A C-terminal domain